MNIALFASAFHPSLGGVEELCRQLALELMRQGHGVIVLTNRWPRDLPADETIDGIRVYRLPFRLPEGSAKAAVNYHLTHRRIENEMLSILRRHQTNMLHVQCVSANAHYAMIAQERLGLPLVVTLQGELTMDANQIFQKSPQAQRILRRALDQAQVITGCSAKTLRDGEEFYGKPFGQRGRVIFNGVNLEDFADHDDSPQRHKDTKGDGAFGTQHLAFSMADTGKSSSAEAGAALPDNLNVDRCSLFVGPQRRPYIFALGRMARQKGFDVLLRAYALVAAAAAKHSASGIEHLEEKGSAALPSRRAGTHTDNTEFTDNTVSAPSAAIPSLIIAGDGPELDNLKSLARELGIAGQVKFPGRADHAAVVRYMKGCELFVLSSRADEGLPVVCAEAMGAGCAIVATRSGGAPEAVLDGQTGLLVDRENVEQLAAAMQRMIADPPLRKRLAAAGKARASEFAWPKIASEYLSAYAAAAAGVRPQNAMRKSNEQ